MNPTTNSITKVLPFDLSEMQNRIFKNKKSEPDLLIMVLKKNHSQKLIKEAEANQDLDLSEEDIPSDNEVFPNNNSSEPNSSSKPKLRKRVSKFDLTKRTSTIVNQRNIEREEREERGQKSLQTQDNVTTVSSSLFCNLL